MAQSKKAYDEARIPFAKMTFSPDVPSSALGPNEYNSGLNVETDVRGIRSVAGDEIVLQSIPGTPTFISGGYRKPQAGKPNDFYFIAATTEGYWYASDGSGAWQDITPAEGPFTGEYSQNTNITEAWNGTVPFYNDENNPPMFWPEFTGQSFETLTASSSAGTSTLTFAPQADEVSGVSILRTDTGGTGVFTYTSGQTLKTGQKVTISGTNTNIYNSRAQNVSIDDNAGRFSFSNMMLPATFVGSISGTTLTVTAVTSGVIYNGMKITGTDSTGTKILADTFISGFTSGSSTGPSIWTVNNSQTIASGTVITGQRLYPLVVGQSVDILGTFPTSTTTLSGVQVVSDTGDFTCSNTTIRAGQSLTISGTISNSDQTLSSVRIMDNVGNFESAAATLQLGQTVQITGTPSTSPSTLSSVEIVGNAGQFTCGASTLLTGQTIKVSGNEPLTPQSLSTVKITGTAGEFSCASATLKVGQSLVVSGTNTSTGFNLSGVAVTGTAGQFSCSAAPTTLLVGQSITVSGEDTGFTLSGVQITGVAGQFSCTASSSTLKVGQSVTISGPLGGGSITDYENPTLYYISATNGSTTFTLTDVNGAALTTTAGVLTGVTVNVNEKSIFGYNDPTTYVISATNGSTTFTLTTPQGTALVTNIGTPTDISFAGTPPGIDGYINPKTYLVSATNGSTTFTITDSSGNPVTTIPGAPTGLSYNISAPSIVGYADPTEYLIKTTNGTTTFTLSNLDGSPIVTTGGTPSGLTLTLEAPAIVDYTDPEEYIISATNGSTTFTLVNKDTGAPISTVGGLATGLTVKVLKPAIGGYVDPTTYVIESTNGSTSFRLIDTDGNAIDTTAGTPSGLTYTIEAPSIDGYTDPTTYYIGDTNGATYFDLVDENGDAIDTTGGLVTSAVTVRVRPPNITGYSDPTTYYIVSTNANNQFTLSDTVGGSPITTRAGVLEGLTFVYSPFGIGQQILVDYIVPTGFRGTHTVTGVTQSSVSFAGSTAGPQTVPGSVSDPHPQMIMYSNTVPGDIDDIEYVDATTQKITLVTPYAVAPYAAGDKIVISGVSNYYNGTYEVVSSTTDTITYKSVPGAAYPSGGSVAPLYAWNYNPNWQGYYAKFMRLYNTPNVGCILVAGGLTVTELDGSIVEYPVTVQWSQAFGLSEAPDTWEPTVLNVANQLEVPLRGSVIDGFPCNGQFFLSSYWDTVVFSPLNYSTTSAPILGVRLHNQGRGMLTSNCWANTDKMVYGLDARDIWSFNGQDFQGLGNQRVKNWFYDQLDSEFTERVFMQTNTEKNQIEIYYPTKPPVIGNINITSTDGWFSCDLQYTYNSGPMRNNLSVVLSGTESGTGSISGYTSPTTYYVVDNYEEDGLTYFQLSTTPTGSGVTTTLGSVTGVNFQFISNGVPNMMLAYRHDLDCFNAPREVQAATFACESPAWTSSEWYYNVTGTTLTGTGTGAHFNILRTVESYVGGITPNVRGTGYAVGDTIKVLGTALGGATPANDATITVATVDSGGRIATVTMTGTAADTWTYNDGRRTVVYARGLTDRTLVQKDEGYNFLGPQLREYPIQSEFRRDNIKMLPDYSGKLLVHRVMPEVNNLFDTGLQVNPATAPDDRLGSVDVKIEGANSVGQAPLETTALTMDIDTDYPWVQIDQNAHRVNSLIIGNRSSESIWICNSTTWQYTQTEDDR